MDKAYSFSLIPVSSCVSKQFLFHLFVVGLDPNFILHSGAHKVEKSVMIITL